jgi:hypothetical protein
MQSIVHKIKTASAVSSHWPFLRLQKMLCLELVAECSLHTPLRFAARLAGGEVGRAYVTQSSPQYNHERLRYGNAQRPLSASLTTENGAIQ